MTFVLAAAFQRGWDDGRLKVGTEYVLEELTRRLSPLNIGPGPDRRLIRQRLASNKAWKSTDSHTDAATDVTQDDIDMEVSACLREAQWIARRRLRFGVDDPQPGWTPAARTAARRALSEAHAVGVVHTHWMHLFASVLADDSSRARELLAELGQEVDGILAALPEGGRLDKNGDPHMVGALQLAALGTLTTPRAWPLRLGTSAVRARLALRGAPSPVIFVLECEAIRQAVRLGAQQVDPSHFFVALCSLEQQLRYKDWRLAKKFHAHNEAGAVLLDCGVTVTSAARQVAQHSMAVAELDRSGFWRREKYNPPTSRDVAALFDRARARAKDLGHRHVGTTHVLLELVDGSELAAAMLNELRVDREALRDALMRALV